MKYLIFGSAWYIENWCEQNNQYFDDGCLVTINNSIKVVSKYRSVHRWYVGTDFFIKKYHEDPQFNIHEYCNFYNFGYPSIISGDFLTRPYGYYCSQGGTMILNVCYDLLNKSMLRHEKCTIGIIGCDLIYNKNKSHFYNGGTNDPLRLGVDLLKTYLDNLKNSFVFSHNLIFNLSEETDTLLPFDKISTDDFYKLKI
jgi:hypothetical protein